MNVLQRISHLKKRILSYSNPESYTKIYGIREFMNYCLDIFKNPVFEKHSKETLKHIQEKYSYLIILTIRII